MSNFRGIQEAILTFDLACQYRSLRVNLFFLATFSEVHTFFLSYRHTDPLEFATFIFMLVKLFSLLLALKNKRRKS